LGEGRSPAAIFIYELHNGSAERAPAGCRFPVQAMNFYWPVVFVIVAAGAASIGFLDAGAPDASAARLVSFVFLGLAAVFTVASRWHGRGRRP